MYKSLRLLLILLLGSIAAQAQTFSTPGTYTYTVPAGVTGLNVSVKGASGGLNSDEPDFPDRAGRGACVNAALVVTPGQVLTVTVGGCGGNGTATTGGVGGFNGGGNGTHGIAIYSGGGGGGGSDISYSGVPLVVAGGGGGAGLNCGADADRGGDGGASIGEDGVGCGTATGGGGGSTPGGIGGTFGFCSTCPGTAGSPGGFGTGGTAGFAGGGGGGGYYGGGGGHWSGGGGGSDYNAGPGLGVYITSDTRGCNSGCGSITINVSCIHGTITGDTTVCVGDCIPQFDAAPGGVWSTSNPAIANIDAGTGVLCGVAAGTVIVTYEISPGTPGCRATRTVTVKALPAGITGPPSVCEGACVTWADATSGGYWTSASTSTATVGSSTGSVCGVLAGSTDILYTDPTTGCSARRLIIVNPSPAPITGTPRVCVSFTTPLSDISTGVTWMSLATGIATVGASTGIVTGASAGTATIITSYTSGCAASIVVTVDPLPSPITGSLIVCMTRFGTVSATPAGGSWSGSGGTGSATIDAAGVITPISTGTWNVTYTMPGGTGCYRTTTVTINPSPPAITGATAVVCEGSTISFSESASGSWAVTPTTVATCVAGPSTITTLTGAYTGIGYGVATLTYTATSTTCYATRDVTVNPRPPVITGTNPVCTGNCVTLTSGTGGTWSPTTGTVGTVDASTGIFCALTAGTVSVRYTYPLTGCFRALVVTVNTTPPPITGPTQLCETGNITLSCALAGGTWTTTAGTGSVTIAPSGTTCVVNGAGAGTAGTCTVSYTMPSGCAASVTITVNPDPSAITSTSSQICAGDCITLNVTPSGGTWSSSLSASGSVDATTGVMCGVFAGVPTISYILPTGCYATYAVTVIANPPVFTPTQVCINSGVTLNGISGSMGGAGTWSSSNMAVGTVNSITGDFTPITTGTTTICYTYTPSGCFRCQGLTVNPAPSAITGPNTVCEAATVTLNVTPAGGNWTVTAGTGTATVGLTNGIVTGLTAGTVTISYTLGTGCNAVKTMTVLASPTPITGTMSICLGQSTILTSGPGGFGDIWTTGATTGSGAVTLVGATNTTTVNVLTTGGPGTATVTYTFAGCSRSAIITINVLSTPITGPGTVCTGSTITLNESLSGTWACAPTTVATCTAGPAAFTTLSGIITGTATVTFSYGGCSTQKTITVNQTPTAAITPLGSTNLCPGDNVTLTATTGAGYTYVWHNPGVIAGATNATYVTGTAGTYFVVVTLGSCSATSPGVNVTVNPVLANISPSGIINTCLSTPPTLNATPSGFVPGSPFSYQWLLSGSPISGAVTATYTPTASGVYSVRVTNVYGCTGVSGTANITLAASPLATVTVSGPLNFCSGGSVTLTTVAGPGYTYQWKLGGLPIAGATNISFTATIAGNYTVTVSNTTGCSTTSSVVTVVVTAPPPATILPGSATVFCAGGSVALAGPLGSYTYIWYKNGVVIPGATSSTYLATTTGNYTIKVTSTLSGCSATSVAQSVTVVPAPLVSPLSATSFCWGGSVTLSATVISGGATIIYQWYKGGVAIPGATNVSYVATTSGSYTVTITVNPTSASPCSVSSVGTTVTMWPLPNPLITFDGIYLHTGTAFVTYQWYKNLVAIPLTVGTLTTGSTTPNCHNTGLGSYTVRVTDIHGCQSVSAAYVVTHFTPKPTPGEDNSIPNGDIRIYPNPATSSVHIESAEVLHVIITGMDGRTVIDKVTADVDLSNVADGIYLIKLYNSDGEMVKAERLVKTSN